MLEMKELSLCLLAVLSVAAESPTELPTLEKKPCQLVPEEGKYFSSENFPGYFNSPTSLAEDHDCNYTMRADSPDKKVLLTFYFMELDSWRCRDSVITIYVNDSDPSYLCGRTVNNEKYLSEGDELVFNFFHRKYNSHRGWMAKYVSVDADYQLDDETATYMANYPANLVQGRDEQVCVEFPDVDEDVDVTVELQHVQERDYSRPPPEPRTTDSVSVSYFEPSDDEEKKVEKFEKLRGKDEQNFCVNFLTEMKEGSAMMRVYFKSRTSSKEDEFVRYVRVVSPEDVIFVQTDKGQYKQGDTVKIRVFSVNDQLKAPEFEISEVRVQDPSFRTIEQWKDLGTKGIEQREFELFEEAQLGTYTIKIKYDGEKENSATFEVSEYVLPRFDINVNAPKVLLPEEESEWEVCAKYTHGAPVPGDIQAKFTSPKRRSWEGNNEIATKTLPADENSGCTKITLSAEDLKSLTDYRDPSSVNVRVDFVEEGTGDNQTSSQSKGLDFQRLTVGFGSSSNNFIVGGFPYAGQVKVTQPDGSPVADETLQVCSRLFKDLEKVRNSFRDYWRLTEDDFLNKVKDITDMKYKEKCQELSTDQQGEVDFVVPLSNIPKDVKKLSLKVKVANQEPENENSKVRAAEGTLNVDLTHTDQPFSMSIQSKEKRELKCNEENKVDLFVEGAQGSSYDVKYYLLSGGQTLQQEKKSVSMTGQSDIIGTDSTVISFDDEIEESERIVKKVEIDFTVDHKAYPELTLLVTLISGNSTLSDSHTFKVSYCTQHQVKLDLNKKQARPREPVTFKVNADEGSMCGVGLVDKSVDILGNPNKVSRNKIGEILKDIKSKKSSTYPDNYDVRSKCSELHKFMEMFENSGRKVQSNLAIFRDCDVATRTKSDGYDYYDYGYDEGIALRGPSVVSAVQFDAPAPAAPPPVPLSSTFLESDNRKNGQGEPIFDPKDSPPLRTEFPETWLFDLEPIENVESRELNAPDTLTSWTASAVCMSPSSGLGVAKSEKLVVSQEFFADLRLPASVKRNEKFPLNISIFNNLERELPLITTIEGLEEEKQMEECLKPRSSSFSSNMMRATEIGDVNVTVTVEIGDVEGCEGFESANGYADKLQRPLLVKAEGIPQEEVDTEMICLDDEQSEQTKSTAVSTPPELDVVSGSERVLTFVSGDVMAASLKNIGNLVRLPTGCGEQNMVKLAPNVYLLQYLQSNPKENKEIMEKALGYMQTGYNRQDKYRHPDGAYSIWGGDSSKDASTWLTAFVIKVFSQASKYIKVDKSKLKKSAKWLMSAQSKDGCFEKRGYVHSSSLQGGNSPQSLNAFVVNSLTEYVSILDDSDDRDQQKTRNEVISSINSGLTCLHSNFTNRDIYTLSLANYATNLAKNRIDEVEVDEEKYTQLKTLVDNQRNDSIAGATFWDATKDSDNRYWWYYPRSLKVEVTAYNIMSLLLENKGADAVNAVKWLARQRNSQGGFQSTQDTVVGLQALSMYGEFIGGYETNMKLQVKDDGEVIEEYSLNEDNKELLNAMRLKGVPENVEFVLSGSGCAVVQTVHKYNVPETKQEPLFDLQTKYEDGVLEICTSYNSQNKEETDMAILEVEMVTGYAAVYPEDLANDIDANVKKVEVDEKENKVVLYFDQLSKEKTCVELQLKKEFQVTDAQPARVVVYDYYNTDERLEKTYKL